MSLSQTINIIKDRHFQSIDELEDYLDYMYVVNEDEYKPKELYNWCYYWVDEFFNSRDCIITKDIVNEFKEYCDNILSCDKLEDLNLSCDSFWKCRILPYECNYDNKKIKELIAEEVREVKECFNNVLEYDFTNNTIWYEQC